MVNTFTRYRALALAAALALPTWALAQQAPTQALAAFAAKARTQGLSEADVLNPLVTSSYTEAGNGVMHTYLLQRVNGLPIFGATAAVHTDRSGNVLSSYQEFMAGAAAKAPSATPTLSPAQAVAAASAALNLGRPTGLQQLDVPSSQGIITFNDGGISQDNIPVQLMYGRTPNGLVLIWNVTIAQLDQQHYWNARVDAHTGQLLDKNDFTVSEQAQFTQTAKRASAKQQKALAFERQAQAEMAALLSPTNTTAAGAVTAFAFPLESPSEGARTNVALPAVGNTWSPYGWAVGQSFGTFATTYSQQSSGKYLTRGNNVAAYDDNSTTTSGAAYSLGNYNSANTSPDGGSTLNYEFPFVQANGPRNNLDASITNLFYVNNMMHDVMAAHGFDEVSGNFQMVNTAGQGRGSDPVRAEAQDGSGRNNANFATPADGSSPSMQMYLWDNIDQALTITSPASIAGRYNYQATTAFGGDISSVGMLCARLVPVNDGTTANGGIGSCTANYTNSAAVNGNIALIQRGGCSTTALNAFVEKVKKAQQNGAVAAIVYDNVQSNPPYVSMGGTDPDITIPAVFISYADGMKIRAALTGTTTAAACLSSQTNADLDGSFDNGVMAHEYGHGISGRITGGPANPNCMTLAYSSNGTVVATQCMGEGWSDFFGLWMTTKQGDVGSKKRGIGTYVVGEAPTGDGIRTYPYSTNMAINPLTYNMIGTAPYTETHAIGEIWTAMIWDLNWQLIYKYGYNPDMYASTGGNNIALKMIIDGMRYQTCNPSFLSGRNGILKADSLNNGGANKALIWTVFARRGLGYSAKAGDRTALSASINVPALTGLVPANDMPPGISPIVLATKGITNATALEAFPNPAADRLTVRTQASSAAPVRVTLYDLLGKAVLTPVTVSAAQMQQAGTELNISSLASGVYIVHVATTEGNYTTRVTVQH